MSDKEIDFLGGGEGFEQLRASDLKTPYLKIAQKMSKEIDVDAPEYVKDLKPGEVYNSITKEILGTKFEVIVLHWNHVWLEYKIGSLGNLLGRHEPDSLPYGAPVNKDDFRVWKTIRETQIVDTYNFFVLVVGKEEQGIAVAPFSGTGVPDAQKLLQMLLMSKTAQGNKASIFAFRWTFETKRNENDRGVFWRYGEGKSASFKPNGQLTKEYFDQFEVGKLAEMARSMKVSASPAPLAIATREDM